MSLCRAHPAVGQELRQPFVTQAGWTQGTSVATGVFLTLTVSVQVAQAPAKGFDLLFVRELLPLGQLQSLEHLFHVFERGAEVLDDMIDLFDGSLDGSG